MSRPHSSLFLNVRKEPNPDAYPSLWEHRLRQRRPISTNPFEPDGTYATNGTASIVERPGLSHLSTAQSEIGQFRKESNESSHDDIQPDDRNHDAVWGEQAPEWLNLFYDLAWTATFASLTSNNKFKAPWDSVTYIVFFTMAWWMWTSQVFYSIDFYTDDWFHLLIIFLQLIIFGALAAVTRGIDVSDYILHSPDSAGWESEDITTVSPEMYNANRVTKLSFEAIALVFAFSRLLLLIQHLRVLIYAKFTTRSRHFPLRLLIVPASLAASTALFFAAFVVTRRHGTEPEGARTKFYLWTVGILVEVIAHVIRFQLDINDGDGIRLKSHGSIVNRFCGITTIIVGEGINAIAGTFYAIEKAPGFGGPTGAGIVSCGFIVFFLIYLYFEGAAPLVTSFLNSVWDLLGQTRSVIESAADDITFNNTLRPLLLQAGTTLDQQLQKYSDLQDQVMTAYNLTELDDDTTSTILNVWFFRLEMSSIANLYITFMDNDTIADDVQQTLTRYQNDFNFTYQDVTGDSADILLDTVWQLIKSTTANARYIMALGGFTFISLAVMNLIQSWPKDRFQWASIISRFAMGIAMSTLLLLNIGKYQVYFPPGDASDSDRAGVFNWIDANWVLPTIALAYGIQFIIDTALVYAAVRFTRKSRSGSVREEKPE